MKGTDLGESGRLALPSTSYGFVHMNRIHLWAAALVLALSGAASADFPEPFPVSMPEPLPVAGSCDLAVCGVGQYGTGCASAGCATAGYGVSGQSMTYTLRPAAATVAVQPVAASGGGHTHQCPNCKYVWNHSEDGGSHVCPRCGSRSFVVSNLPPTRGTSAALVRQVVTGPTYAGIDRAAPEPQPVYGYEPAAARVVYVQAAPSTYQVASYSAASYSTMSAGCGSSSSGYGALGRAPRLRVRGGPGLFPSLFRGCGG